MSRHGRKPAAGLPSTAVPGSLRFWLLSCSSNFTRRIPAFIRPADSTRASSAQRSLYAAFISRST
jgi:hypothetical protein